MTTNNSVRILQSVCNIAVSNIRELKRNIGLCLVDTQACPHTNSDVTHQSNINSINQELMTHEIAAVIWRSYMRPWILSCLSFFESLVQNVMNSLKRVQWRVWWRGLFFISQFSMINAALGWSKKEIYKQQTKSGLMNYLCINHDSHSDKTATFLFL